MSTATDLMMLGSSVSSKAGGGGGAKGGRNSGEEGSVVEVGHGGGVGGEKTSQLPPRIRPEVDLNDNTLFAVYCFIKNFIGASGTSAVAIDNKIEQAMDLVKSHLMFAVREEVEVLKEKIAELMERINQLEVENSILKAHASSETLAQLGGGGAGGGGQALPPTASMQMQVQGQQQAS